MLSLNPMRSATSLSLMVARAIPISRVTQGHLDCACDPCPAHQERAPLTSLQGGCVMVNFDLTPLYRTTVGFDRLGSLFDTLGSLDNDAPSYPPYNIELVDENTYRI